MTTATLEKTAEKSEDMKLLGKCVEERTRLETEAKNGAPRLPSIECPCFSSEKPNCTYWNSWCMVNESGENGDANTCYYRIQHVNGLSYENWLNLIGEKLG